MLFAAVHESGCGTKQTSLSLSPKSVVGGKAVSRGRLLTLAV